MANRISTPVKVMALMRTMAAGELGVLLDIALAEFRPKAKKKVAKRVQSAPLTPTGLKKAVEETSGVTDAMRSTLGGPQTATEARHPGDKLRVKPASTL